MLMNNSVTPFTRTIVNFSDMIDIVNAEMDEIYYGKRDRPGGHGYRADKIQTAGLTLGLRG
jgi:hypothetical protein